QRKLSGSAGVSEELCPSSGRPVPLPISEIRTSGGRREPARPTPRRDRECSEHCLPSGTASTGVSIQPYNPPPKNYVSAETATARSKSGPCSDSSLSANQLAINRDVGRALW